MVQQFDFLVIGSGIAGMSLALKVADKGKVAIICKTELEEANTYFAQGGIASVTNLLVDNFDKHIEDTMIAGDWISNRAAVEKVVREAPAQIEELIKWGVDFDKNEKGEFDLHREGGHSEFRILHHKDNTGAEIQDSLIKAVQRHPNITVIENQFAIEINLFESREEVIPVTLRFAVIPGWDAQQQNVISFQIFFAAFCNVMDIGNVFTKLFLNHFCDIFGITGVAAEKDASDSHE